MTFYSNLQATADSLLTEFGTSVTIRRERSDTPESNPWEGKTSSVSTYSAYAVLDKRSPIYNKDTIHRKDTVTAYISASGVSFTPEIKDYVVIGSDEYKIVGIEVINPAGTELLYIAELVK